MLMDIQRVDGLKYDFDRLRPDEIEGIHGHLLTQHARLVGDIALVEERLYLINNGGQAPPTPEPIYSD